MSPVNIVFIIIIIIIIIIINDDYTSTTSPVFDWFTHWQQGAIFER